MKEQELRNAIYTGEWLSDAKRYFSKNGCATYLLANKYLNGEVNRQDYLETVLTWISAKENINIDGLIETIKAHIFADIVRTKMLIPYTRGDVSSYLCEKATVASMEYLAEGTLLDVEMKQEDYQRYKEYEVI